MKYRMGTHEWLSVAYWLESHGYLNIAWHLQEVVKQSRLVLTFNLKQTLWINPSECPMIDEAMADLVRQAEEQRLADMMETQFVSY